MNKVGRGLYNISGCLILILEDPEEAVRIPFCSAGSKLRFEIGAVLKSECVLRIRSTGVNAEEANVEICLGYDELASMVKEIERVRKEGFD